MHLTVRLTTRPLRAFPRIAVIVVVVIIVASATWAAYGPASVVALFAGTGVLAPVLTRYTGSRR